MARITIRDSREPFPHSAERPPRPPQRRFPRRKAVGKLDPAVAPRTAVRGREREEGREGGREGKGGRKGFLELGFFGGGGGGARSSRCVLAERRTRPVAVAACLLRSSHAQSVSQSITSSPYIRMMPFHFLVLCPSVSANLFSCNGSR